MAVEASVVEGLTVFLAFFLALGVLTVVLLALLDVAAEELRLRLLTSGELRRRFDKRLRSRPTVEEGTQEITLENTKEPPTVQRSRWRSWR